MRAIRHPFRNRWRPRAAAAFAAAVATALALSSCTAPVPQAAAGQSVSSPDPAVIQGVPANLSGFYSQAVTWSSCEKTFQCAKVKVPLDYANPAGSLH